MNKNLFPNKKHQSYFFLFLYSTLIIGFILNENSSGGAIIDYLNQKIISKKFSERFLEVFFNFDKETTRHSPLLIIILSLFEKFNINDGIIRIINLHFLLLIILFFYKCLKIKFKNYNKTILHLISFLLFLSPTYRSLSIWPDSRLYGLLLFIVSIYFFLNFIEEKNKKKKFKYSLLNTFYLCIASYFSPNYCVFVIFFVLSFFNYFKISKYSYSIIFLNLLLSAPALYYVFYLKIFFFLTGVSDSSATIIALNPANKIILISSIFLFHYFPFFFIAKNKYIISNKNLIILIFIFSTLIYFFNYRIDFTGGGFIYKLSNLIFNNNYFLFFFSFLGFLLLFNLSYKNLNNFLLIFLIIISNPQLEVYHKYYEPMLLMIIFTLFKISINKNFLKKRFLIFYLFNFLFLIANLLK